MADKVNFIAPYILSSRLRASLYDGAKPHGRRSEITKPLYIYRDPLRATVAHPVSR